MLENRIYNKNNRAKIKKKGGTHYASKDYSNPFFTERKNNLNKNNRFFNWRIKILSLLLALIAIFFVWFLLYSEYFEIKNIIAEGNGAINKEEIIKIAWNEINFKSYIFSPKSNLIFYNKRNIIDRIEEKYLFDKIEIERDKSNTIKISYTEKKQSFIWIENEKYYKADRNGYIISETTEEESKLDNLPIIENKSSLKINNKKISTEGNYIDFIFSLSDKYNEYKGFTVNRFIVDDSINIVKTSLIDGPEIYFSINTDINKQLDKLTIIKNEKFKDDFKTKEYIDVSVGDSIYYK